MALFLDNSPKSGLLKPLLIGWTIISFVLIYSCWDIVTSRNGWDPDDQLRLVQLRDFLGGQSWFDVTQYRLNPPEGGPMHWSRLIEIPLAILILLLTPLFGQAGAEIIAGSFIPLFGFGIVAYMLGRIAKHLHSTEAGIVAMGVTLIAPPLLLQFRPMRIDHHGWQIVMATLSLWTLFWPNKKIAGAVLGCALAVWLHISLEGAPLTAGFFIYLGWRWVFGRAHALRLLWTIGALAIASMILFFGTQSASFSAPIFCDTVSMPHVVAILLAAAIMMPAIILKPADRRIRMVAASAAGIAAIGVLVYLAPQCTKGAFGNLDPLVRDYWYVNVNEGLPIWRQDMHSALTFSAGTICGLLALYFGFRNLQNSQKADWQIAGFFAVYTTLISLLVFRTISVAAAYAVPLVAIWIIQLFQQYRISLYATKRIGLIASILALIVPGAIASAVGKNIFPQETVQVAKAKKTNEKCMETSSVAALNALPTGNFIAPFDMGPAILLTTKHSVLASSHHRNERAMHDHIAIFKSDPATAWQYLKAHQISYIAVCPKEAEMEYYQKRDPKGLWAILASGNWPGYITPMPDMGDGVKIWRVRG
jgi:hypothetical protein